LTVQLAMFAMRVKSGARAVASCTVNPPRLV